MTALIVKAAIAGVKIVHTSPPKTHNALATTNPRVIKTNEHNITKPL
jgi:hypothetical protein